MVESQVGESEELAEFLIEARARLERALVARFGVEEGTEAAAEAVAYALANWPALRPMANPVGYLYRVGQTRARRTVERRSRLESLVSDPLTTDQVVDVDLQRALCRLKPDQRVAVVLVHAFGYSYRDAGEVLDVPATTVANHLNRGLVRLRRLLEQQ